MAAVQPVPDTAVERLFHAAPPTAAWSSRPVPRQVLDELHALVSLCPASAPQAPASFLFVTSEAGKARLLRHTPLRQRHRVLLAPVCALVGYDLAFAEQLVLSAAPGFSGPALRETARRTAALQGPYLMLAARTLGLETAPLEDLDLKGLTGEFFGGRNVAAFACAIGYPLD